MRVRTRIAGFRLLQVEESPKLGTDDLRCSPLKTDNSDAGGDAYDWSAELEKIRRKTQLQRLSIRQTTEKFLQSHITRQHLIDLQRSFQYLEKQRFHSHLRSFSNRSARSVRSSFHRKSDVQRDVRKCPLLEITDLSGIRADSIAKEGKKYCVTPQKYTLRSHRKRSRRSVLSSHRSEESAGD